MKLYGRAALGPVLLGFALLLGGGSPLFPLTRLIVEAAGAGVLAWCTVRGWRAPVDVWSGVVLLFILSMLALPLVQLIPLPSSVWTVLPGREEVANVLQATGSGLRWMPISLQPDATRLAATFLIPPIGMFIVTAHATSAQRVVYGWVIVAMALIGSFLGLLQTSGSTDFYLYDTGSYTAATGFFANKNHQADFLLLAILLAPALTRTGHRLGIKSPPTLAAAGVVSILILAIPAANSRMGLVLLPIAALPAVLMLIPQGFYRRVRLREAVIGIMLVSTLTIVAASSGVVTRLLDRFGGDPDARLKYWPDVMRAIAQYRFMGSGLGSFIRVFQQYESMSTLSFTYVNHAHNDFLEIVLEAGGAGAALILFGVLIWLAGARRVLRRSAWGAFTPIHVACVFGILILVVHSSVDYPLRTLSLACVLAFFAGCLAPAVIEREPTASGVDRG